MLESNRSRALESQRSRRSRVLLPYLILAFGLCFTFLVSFYFSQLAEAQDLSRFRNSVRQIDDRITARIQTSIALLRAGTGLFAASDSVSAGEFDRFVQQIELQKNYPGIQGIGFSLKFSTDQKTEIIAARHREGLPDFKVWPDYPRDEYHAIVYLQPADSRNKRAVGYDMFTDPVRHDAMALARDTGTPTASGRVVLIQETDVQNQQAGFLIYAPVYRNNVPVTTVDERRKALFGFVYSPFRVDDFLAPVISDNNRDVSFQVYDGVEAKPESLLHVSFSEAASSGSRSPHFTTVTTQNVAGRTWTITYATKPSFELSSSHAFLPYTIAAGVLLSCLFFAVTRSEVHRRAAAERAATELGQSEATIRTTLAERELAEEALRESEERYRELVENANDIVYMLNLDGRITSINKAAEVITEYSQEELLGMNIADILTSDSVEAGKQMLISTTTADGRTNYEVDIVSRKGRILTLEISNKLISRGFEPMEIQGIARDISTRRRAEEALREADQRALSEYERLLERISGLAQALGTARELSTIFRGLREFTKVSVPCDGFFVSLYDPLRDVRTACYGWGDEKELDVSDLPPMPITASGPNSRAVRTGQVVITDDYMDATKGHSSVIVGPDNGLRPQSSMAVPMAVMGRIIGTIEVQSYTRRVYLQEHVTAMSMAANLTAVAIENVRLLKLERTAREAAEESNRLKDEFLATVSHELRTPLTAILGWSRMLEGGALDEKVTKQAVETIWRNAKSQAQIIDDILDVSRIITGNLYLDLHPMRLAPVVQAAINVVRQTADAKGIRIDVELDSTPGVISGDANRLQQVIWNLLSNAVKFTGSGGHVSLKLRQVNSAVEISVADTGQGISREFLPFVFDRFRQADSSTTRKHGGLGLGLAIARHLVEIHGGTIRAESGGENQGATFTIRLPLIDYFAKSTELDPVDAEKVLSAKPIQLLAGLHILLVDDDTDALQLMSTALMGRQANVTAVTSAGEALQAIRNHRPDVLVSDIAMPEEDGYGLIAKVRSLEAGQSQSIPAVAITAYAKDEDRARALSSGFQIYLAKPVEITELVSVVARAARREF